MKVSRQEFLQQLESVQPGLSPKEIVEQSSCFVFKENRIYTYNDEISCSLKSRMDITGAVQAAPLLALLGKLVDDEIDISEGDGELMIKGKRWSSGIRMEHEIMLPLESVEPPKEWKKLPEDFAEAVQIVHQCASKDASKVELSSIHIHPKWIEACDNHQITRYRLRTGVEDSMLIRQSSLKHMIPLGMVKFSETESWMHFKNQMGLVFSCRRYLEEFPNLKSMLKVKGTPTTLPKGLAEAAEKAAIFSADNGEDEDLVTITLKAGKLRIKGAGVSGWFKKPMKLKYSGEPLMFLISPQLLAELTRRHNDCFVTEDRLKVKGEKWTYVTCLGALEEKGE